MATKTNGTVMRPLTRLLMCVQMLSDIRDKIPSQAILLLLYVATRERGISAAEGAKFIGVKQSAAARNFGLLGEGAYSMHGKTIEGAGLVSMTTDPYDARAMLYTLTPSYD